MKSKQNTPAKTTRLYVYLPEIAQSLFLKK